MNYKVGSKVIVISNDKSTLVSGLMNIPLEIKRIEENGKLILKTEAVWNELIRGFWASSGYAYSEEVIPVTKLHKILE